MTASARRAPKRGTVIAIDGPAGAGKSTLARALAEELGLPYVNTGLMYRALADRALALRVEPDDGPGLARLAASMRFGVSEATRELVIDDRDPWPSLTSVAVEAMVSRVASHPAVRRVMRDRQRTIGLGGAVMEGRDIGTVVFPDADLKIFLSAPLPERERRRLRERGGGRGVAESVSRRDAQDARTNPLRPAADAHLIDTWERDPDAVLAAALELAAGLRGPEGQP